MNHEGQKHKYKHHDKSKTETRRYDRLLGDRDHGRQITSLKICSKRKKHQLNPGEPRNRQEDPAQNN